MGVLRETERSGFADQLDSWSEVVDAEAAQLMRLRVGRGCAGRVSGVACPGAPNVSLGLRFSLSPTWLCFIYSLASPSGTFCLHAEKDDIFSPRVPDLFPAHQNRAVRLWPGGSDG